MAVSYATVLKAADTVRRAILAQALTRPNCMKQASGPVRQSQAHGRDGQRPILGVIEIGMAKPSAICSRISGPRASCTQAQFLAQDRKLRRPDRARDHPTSSIRPWSPAGPACGRRATSNTRTSACLLEGSPFGPLAKQRLRQPGAGLHFPLYLKECELRFNSRDKDLIPILVHMLCAFVPRPFAQNAALARAAYRRTARERKTLLANSPAPKAKASTAHVRGPALHGVTNTILIKSICKEWKCKYLSFFPP